MILLALPAASLGANQKQVIGWVEPVRLNHDFRLSAKIDTGAKHSSINAPDYQIVKKNKSIWVNFSLTNKQGNKLVFEEKVLRIAKIKRKGQTPKDRPVVMMGICLSNVFKELEVNLENRKNFNYQVLIGRSFLKGNFIIDPEISYASKPDCK